MIYPQHAQPASASSPTMPGLDRRTRRPCRHGNAHSTSRNIRSAARSMPALMLKITHVNLRNAPTA